MPSVAKNTHIKRNSQVHLALMYLKMKSVPVSSQQLQELAPKRFSEIPRARQSLMRLVELGFAVVEDDMYHITPEGKTAACLIVAQQKFTLNDKS